MALPKSVDEILAHASELSNKFESYEPTEAELAFARELARVQHAVINRAQAEALLCDEVLAAREAGAPWTSIGALLGTTGEAARQKFGKRKVKAAAAR